MNLLVKLKIEFDDDKGTVLVRQLWVKNLPPIDPTHAIVKAVIEEAHA